MRASIGVFPSTMPSKWRWTAPSSPCHCCCEVHRIVVSVRAFRGPDSSAKDEPVDQVQSLGTRRFLHTGQQLQTRKSPRRRAKPAGRKEWESQTGKNSPGSKKYHSGRVSSILAALAEKNCPSVSSVLDPWAGKLESREQSIILKEQRDWRLAVEIFRWFQGQENSKANVYLYNILLRTLGKAGKWDLLQRFWREMLEEKVVPTIFTYSTLVDVHGRAGMKSEAEFFYRHMVESGVEPDEVMVSTYINLQRRFGDVKEAEKAFWGLFAENSVDGSVKRPENPETYNTMITLYGEQGKFAEASKVFAEMMKAGVKLTTVTFNAMIHIYGKVGRIKEAEVLVAKMKKREDCQPDVATYNSLIETYVKNDKLELVSGCLESMRESGVTADQVTFRTLISAYAANNIVWKAEVTVQQMEEQGFVIDQAIYTVMIAMYVRARDITKAEEVFRFLHTRGLEVSTYVGVMDVFAEHKCLVQAREVFELSKKESVKHPSLYNVLMKAYGACGQFSEAVTVFEGMEKDGVSPSEATYNSLVQLLCKGRLLESLQRILVLMKAAGFKASLESSSSIISFYGDVGRVREAEKIFKELVASGVEPDMICYSAMLNAYAEAGFANEAQDILDKAKTAGFIPDTIIYTSMMKLYSNLGLIKEAEKIYSDMSTLKPDLFAANTMLNLYIKSGMYIEAEQLFRAMQRGDPGLNEVACSMMLKVYRETDKIEQGLDVVRVMSRRFLITDVPAFNGVIAMYVKAGLMREAVEAIKEMRRVGLIPNRSTFGCFEEVLEKAGMVPRESIQKLQESTTTLETMVILTLLYAQAGMSDEAAEIAFAIQRAERDEGLELDVDAYNALIYSFGKAGKLDVALQVYSRMKAKGVELNEASYGSIIAAYGKVGLLEGVGRMFRRLKENGFQPSPATYRTVLEVYREAGRVDLASMVSQEFHLSKYIQQQIELD